MWGGGPGLSPLPIILIVALSAAVVGFLAWALWVRPAPRRLRRDERPVLGRPPGEGRADGPGSAPGEMRVSDAERDEVIEQLGRHASEGRLSLDEFEARVEVVAAAKTVSQLRDTLRDLPAPHPKRSR